MNHYYSAVSPGSSVVDVSTCSVRVGASKFTLHLCLLYLGGQVQSQVVKED